MLETITSVPASTAQAILAPLDIACVVVALRRGVLPDWIAQARASPEVPVRLRALDLWAQQGAQAPLDPLVVALDDADEDVRTKAMAIVERHWAVKQEPEAEK
jgi:HEAT repeat protein